MCTYHRVARVGRDLKDSLVTTPCHGQGNHRLGQVAQSGPEHLQGWDPLRAVAAPDQEHGLIRRASAETGKEKKNREQISC